MILPGLLHQNCPSHHLTICLREDLKDPSRTPLLYGSLSARGGASSSLPHPRDRGPKPPQWSLPLQQSLPGKGKAAFTLFLAPTSLPDGGPLICPCVASLDGREGSTLPQARGQPRPWSAAVPPPVGPPKAAMPSRTWKAAQRCILQMALLGTSLLLSSSALLTRNLVHINEAASFCCSSSSPERAGSRGGGCLLLLAGGRDVLRGLGLSVCGRLTSWRFSPQRSRASAHLAVCVQGKASVEEEASRAPG